MGTADIRGALEISSDDPIRTLSMPAPAGASLPKLFKIVT
jgi:hypothetical protein